eukprot:4673266-Prymnesium_polylepis.1
MSEEKGKWPDFPGNDPTLKETQDWLKTWNASLKSTDVEFLLNRDVPPSLISISRGADVSDL